MEAWDICNDIFTFNEALENLSTGIVELTKMDESSNEDGVGIILTWKSLEINKEKSVVEDYEGNTIRFSYTE